jgi:hypothetical protein
MPFEAGSADVAASGHNTWALMLENGGRKDGKIYPTTPAGDKCIGRRQKCRYIEY